MPPGIRFSLPPNGGAKSGRVGVELEEIRSRLLDAAGRLEPLLDSHAVPLVAEARRVLQDHEVRVAVIGQIKAGKSTFINAFTNCGDLLPTDVNPWTAVVTHLRFRNDRSLPQHRALFHLFSRDEWERLAEGGGRLRELTERLVPGFEPELLRAQLEAMRQRAESRLGPELDELLGQTHAYEQISPELLDDYVSAGTYLVEGAPAPGRMLYSDITRTAELFFDGGPFALPATLIDTPGTNDPFLVRDEVTRRALEKSDVYIFVISALQPLSATDISLLRILNGLHKDRIVVFLNRIDQLRNPLVDGQAVWSSVKGRLEREFPALDIPLISGSAWWGGLAMQADSKDVTRLLPQPSVAYLRQVGLPADIEVGPGKPLTPDQRAQVAAALHVGSGIPAVASAITNLLAGGSTAVLLRQLAACFHELARSTETSAKMEHQSVLGLLDSHRAETRAVAERLQTERRQLAQLDQPIRQIQASFGLIERQLNDIVTTDLGHLRSDMRAIVDRFAAEESHALASSIRHRDHDGQWHCDLGSLREEIEIRYVEAYRATEGHLIEIERVLYPQLRTIIDAIVPGSGLELTDDHAVHPSPYPDVAPLSETLVLDLDVPWWKAWFAARPDPSVRAAELRRLIYDDFLPLLEQLAETAAQQLNVRIYRTLQQAQAVSTGLLGAMQQRKAQVIADYEAFSSSNNSPEVFDQQQQAKADACDQRRMAAADLSAELAALQSFCQKVLLSEVRSP